MKSIVQFFLVVYLGLVFANSIENAAVQKSSQSTEKSNNNIQYSHSNTGSNLFLSVESPKEKENGAQSQTLNSITASLFLPTTENTKGLINYTESKQSKNYTKDQEELIHSDSQESLLKGNQLFPSAAGTSLKRSYSSNNNVSGANAIESAGSGYYDKTLDVNGQDYGHTDADHNGEKDTYHHQSTPFKPSIVHRDPHDKYDRHDKIRTLDRDHIFYDKHKADYGYRQHEPYHYDGQKIPDCVQKNIYFYNLTFCLEDHHYPKDDVLWAIKQAGEHAFQLLTDVTYQSADNLIDSLTRAEEEGHIYQPLHPNPNKPFKRSGYSTKDNSHQKDGYICPSDIYYGRPRRAMNTNGKWKVIVNLDYVPHSLPYDHQTHPSDHSSDEHHRQYHHEILPTGSEHTGYQHRHHANEYFHNIHRNKVYTQTLRLEQCIHPYTPCSYIDSHYQSRCLQKHNFVRLVAWTYEMGLHVDTFKMPIACSCHVKQSNHFHHDHESEYGFASQSAAVTISPKTNN